MDRKTVRTAIAIVAVVLVLILVAIRSAKDRTPPNPGPGDAASAEPSVHLAMGNPSGATDTPGDSNNFLMRKPYFALSFRSATGTPNWVSWCLKESDLGSAPRTEFYPDADLPSGFPRIVPRDYTGGGFDRGHMCPRSDRASTPEAAASTFVMTNIVPQSPHLNQRAWNDFEDYCRGLVRGKPRALYIVSGPHGRGGTGSAGAAETIAGGKITAPAQCWKVVLAVEGGTGVRDDVGRVGPSSRAIAVVMPNDQSVGHGWSKYRTSVEAVETLTGYKFFDRVPTSVIGPLKAKVDDERIPPGVHPKGED